MHRNKIGDNPGRQSWVAVAKVAKVETWLLSMNTFASDDVQNIEEENI